MEKISKEEKSIVIGSGIAGLLASRVLSDHFANVVLIEKDHYPENAGPRNGTPDFQLFRSIDIQPTTL